MAANKKVSELTDGVRAELTDLLYALRSPFGAGDDVKLEVQDVLSLFGLGDASFTPEMYGAAGDGLFFSNGTTVNGDNTFTCSSATFTDADVGKAITIAGAGAAGATLATTIASRNSATSVELTNAPSTSLAATADFYYGTDDTTAFQNCINGTTDGEAIVLAPKIYMVDNLALKGGIGTHGFKRKALICPAGMATITTTGQGSADYLVASERWITGSPNASFAEAPYIVRNIIFDAFGLKSLAFVHKMFGAIIADCIFQNALVANFRVTRQNQDTSLGTASYLSGNRYQDCMSIQTIPVTVTYGFHSQGTASDPADSTTDAHLINFEVHGGSTGAMTTAIYLGNTGGWTILGNRTYSCNIGIEVYRWGKNCATGGNNWDATTGIAARVNEITTYIDYGGFVNDNFYTDLWVNFSNDATTEYFTVSNCHFYFDPVETTSGIFSDGQARIIHNNNRASKIIRSVNNNFQADNSHVRNSGNTLGVFDIYGNFSVEDTTNYQRQYWDSGATGPVDNYLHASASPAANDILHRANYGGLDSGGNVTSYTTTEAYLRDATDTSEDAGWRVNSQVAGTLRQRLAIDDRGTFVGASSTVDPGTAQVGLQIVGDSYSTSGISGSRYTADADGCYWSGYKSRGSTVGTHTVVNSGDVLLRIQGRGADGTTSRCAGEIQFVVDGTPGSSDMPGRLLFLTTPDGSATQVERLRIDNKGNVLVNTAAIATNATDGFLYVPTCAGTPTGVPTSYTGRAPIVIDSTNNKMYFYSNGAWRDAGP